MAWYLVKDRDNCTFTTAQKKRLIMKNKMDKI
jgi:hypothetical protein